MMENDMSVASYYAYKNVFITGATGFLGKVLVEKLLRSCPDIGDIYILIREKWENTPQQRLQEFLNNRVFDKIRYKKHGVLSKVKLLTGDILLPLLGLSIKDQSILRKECNIIFHCAACVRFDLSIGDAVKMNTCGTQQMLRLARQMHKLKAFVHVSTSYCHCKISHLKEHVYAPEHDPEDVISIVRWMNSDLLNHIEPKLIASQPNTYAYTKSLTEKLVYQYRGYFPMAIARPSIVTASWKEPMPGWVDNLNGPTGLIVGAGKGVIRSMLCRDSYLADVMPVDFVVNGFILIAREIGLKGAKKLTYYNVTESSVNPITWKTALALGRNYVHDYPFENVLWYPGGSPKTSKVYHKIAHLFLHILPAYVIDFFMYLFGEKTFMVRLQKRISTGLELVQYYTMKEWHFDNTNFLALRNNISEVDDKIFYTNIKELNWNDYMKDYVKGAREYCCKESPDTLPQSRKKIQRLYILDSVLKFAFYAFILIFIYQIINSFM